MIFGISISSVRNGSAQCLTDKLIFEHSAASGVNVTFNELLFENTSIAKWHWSAHLVLTVR